MNKMVSVSLLMLGMSGFSNASPTPDVIMNKEYSAGKAELINAGWTPVAEPGVEPMIASQPETASCSGAGWCQSFYKNADGTKLNVSTVGFEQQNEDGTVDKPVITNLAIVDQFPWESMPSPSPSPSPAKSHAKAPDLEVQRKEILASIVQKNYAERDKLCGQYSDIYKEVAISRDSGLTYEDVAQQAVENYPSRPKEIMQAYGDAIMAVYQNEYSNYNAVVVKNLSFQKCKGMLNQTYDNQIQKEYESELKRQGLSS